MRVGRWGCGLEGCAIRQGKADFGGVGKSAYGVGCGHSNLPLPVEFWLQDEACISSSSEHTGLHFAAVVGVLKRHHYSTTDFSDPYRTESYLFSNKSKVSNVYRIVSKK